MHGYCTLDHVEKKFEVNLKFFYLFDNLSNFIDRILNSVKGISNSAIFETGILNKFPAVMKKKYVFLWNTYTSSSLKEVSHHSDTRPM